MVYDFTILKSQYYDSVFLMGVSKRISDVSGMSQNAVLMASEANKRLLHDLGFRDKRIEDAHPNDLIIAVAAESQEIIDLVLSNVDKYLQGGVQKEKTSNPHSLEEGLAQKPEFNLAVISIPGEYAAREAQKALRSGLNVFLFSDNVTLEDELALKQLAQQKNLFMMGPDCGTSLIGGVGIGFANAVRKGPIGVIGASGTGLQEFTSMVHNAGSGISHAIGTGGRDLTDQIGGLTTISALEALENDRETRVIAVISKPPGQKALNILTDRFKSLQKPLIACFLGTQEDTGTEYQSFHRAHVIDEAVRVALSLVGVNTAEFNTNIPSSYLERIPHEKTSWNVKQNSLRGLFAGGTFCYQSQQILKDAGIFVYSNSPINARYTLKKQNHNVNHTLIDMGADEYTLGKPHPMIDGTLRKHRIISESRDAHIAILLLDFILGYNASMDPVGELLGAVQIARENVKKKGGNLTIVASVCGTDRDPQDLNTQVNMLEEAGVFTFRSNALATMFCCELLRK